MRGRPSPKPGIDLANAEKTLRSVATAASNVSGSAAGSAIPDLRNKYLDWVNAARVQLRNFFIDPETWRHLEDERYWQIRHLAEGSAQGQRLIVDTLDDQARCVDDLANRIETLRDRLTAAPGRLAVVDTNVLLHFLPPNNIPWREVVGASEVRLVLPLRVIEELDEKKYTARDDLADRARRLISQLRTLLAPAGAPAPLAEGVTVEVPVDDGPRSRTLDADQEVLDTCKELQFSTDAPALVTDDGGMMLRAGAMGIEVVPMPEKFLRKRPKADPTSSLG